MIGRRALLIIINRGFGTLVGYFGLLFIVRFFDKGAYGMYSFTLALVALFAVIRGLGIDRAHVKRLSEGHDEARANGTYVVLKLALTGSFLVFLGIGLLIWTQALGRGFTEATSLRLVAVFVLISVAQALREVFGHTFEGHRRTAVREVVLLVDSVVTALGFIVVSIAYRHQAGGTVPMPEVARAASSVLPGPWTGEQAALYLAGAFVLGTAVSYVVALAFFLANRYPIGRPASHTVRRYVDFAKHAALINVFAIIVLQIDQVLLGFFWSRLETADYRVATQLLMPTLVVSQAVAIVLMPTISADLARGSRDLANLSVQRAGRYISMTVMGVLMLAMVFAPEGLHVVGSDAYLSATSTLRILTLFALVTSIMVPYRALLMGSDRPAAVARAGAIMAAATVVLDLVLIPDSLFGVPMFGLKAEGAAIGSVAAVLLGYGYVAREASRQGALAILPEGVGRQGAAAVVAGVVLWLSRDALGPAWFDRVWELGAAGAVGLGLYGALLVLFGGFTRTDWDFLRYVLHPGQMRDYLRSDLRRRGGQGQR